MNRRDFLKLLSISAAGIAAPKFFIDMGKNGRLYTVDWMPILAPSVGTVGGIDRRPLNHWLDAAPLVPGMAYFDADGFAYIKGELLTTLSPY